MPPPRNPARPGPGSRPGQALAEGRAPVLAGIVLPALNLRTAVTSITPLLDELGRVFGFGATMAGMLGDAAERGVRGVRLNPGAVREVTALVSSFPPSRE